jgi:hypothetical protein
VRRCGSGGIYERDDDAAPEIDDAQPADGGYLVRFDIGRVELSGYCSTKLDAMVECFEHNVEIHEDLSSQTIARACSEVVGLDYGGRDLIACATGAPRPGPSATDTDDYIEGAWSSEDDAGAAVDNCARECFPSWR